MKDQICELNYHETKCEIETKMGDQKCNFIFFLILECAGNKQQPDDIISTTNQYVHVVTHPNELGPPLVHSKWFYDMKENSKGNNLHSDIHKYLLIINIDNM